MTSEQSAQTTHEDDHEEGPLNYWYILGLFVFFTLAFYVTMLLSKI